MAKNKGTANVGTMRESNVPSGSTWVWAAVRHTLL